MKESPVILIADDSPSIRAKLREAFSEKGFKVVEATDGIDCIIKVFKYFPSFVVLDVQMPKINGYQACRFLKNHPKTCDIPVMLLTVLDKPIDEFWGYETGADLFRSKNADVKSLLEDVHTYMKTHSFLPKKEETKITETDILTFLNEILEKRLFELTLINNITNLAFKTNNVDELVVACAQYLYHITDFYCIGFAIEYEERFKVYIYSKYEYDKHLDNMIKYIKETLSKYTSGGIDFIYNVGNLPVSLDTYKNTKIVFLEKGSISEKTPPSKSLSEGVFLSVDEKNVNLVKDFSFLINTVLLVIRSGTLYQKVLDLSIIDELTMLFNRRKIMEILRTEIERCERYGYDLSVIMADIDNFKHINYNYGHKMGDDVLKRVASILKNSVRKVDYVGRFGGEEFLIVPPQTSLENAVKLAERIRGIVELTSIEGLDRKITISFGVSSYRNTMLLDKLLIEADKALYDAKKSGKNKVKWRE